MMTTPSIEMPLTAETPASTLGPVLVEVGSPRANFVQQPSPEAVACFQAAMAEPLRENARVGRLLAEVVPLASPAPSTAPTVAPPEMSGTRTEDVKPAPAVADSVIPSVGNGESPAVTAPRGSVAGEAKPREFIGKEPVAEQPQIVVERELTPAGRPALPEVPVVVAPDSVRTVSSSVETGTAPSAVSPVTRGEPFVEAALPPSIARISVVVAGEVVREVVAAGQPPETLRVGGSERGQGDRVERSETQRLEPLESSSENEPTKVGVRESEVSVARTPTPAFHATDETPARVDAVPADDMPVRVEAAPASDMPVRVETAPAVEKPVRVEAAPAVEKPVRVEAAPAAEKPEHVETAPAAEKPVRVEAAPAAEKPEHVETAPAVEKPVRVEAAPAVEKPVRVEAAPAAEKPVRVEAAPAAEKPVRVEAAPVAEKPVRIEAVPAADDRPDAERLVAAGANPAAVSGQRTAEVASVKENEAVAPIAALSAKARVVHADVLVEAVTAVADTLLVSPGLMRGEGEILVQLKPEVLDGSQIRITVQGKTLEVAFQTPTELVAQMLTTRLPELQQHLVAALPAFSFKVSVGQGTCLSRGTGRKEAV